MFFTAPWALAGVLLVVLVLLQFKAPARVQSWPSLRLWQEAARQPSVSGQALTRPRNSRRYQLAAAVLLLAIAAAGPASWATVPRRVRIVVDQSASTHAMSEQGRASRAEQLLASAEALAASPEQLVVVAGSNEALERAVVTASQDADYVLVLSDHLFDASGLPKTHVQTWIPTSPAPGGNVAIIAAGRRALASDRTAVHVRVGRYQLAPTGGSVSCTIAAIAEGGGLLSRQALALPANTERSIHLQLSCPAEASFTVTVQIDPAFNSLKSDDEVVFPNAKTALRVGVYPPPAGSLPRPIQDALSANGYVAVAPHEPHDFALHWKAATLPLSAIPTIVVAENPGPGLPATLVYSAHNSPLPVCTAPHLRPDLAPATAPPGLRAVWVDDLGRCTLGVRDHHDHPLVWCGLPMSQTAFLTHWAPLASFPAFFYSAGRYLVGDRHATHSPRGLLSRGESREAAMGTRTAKPPGPGKIIDTHDWVSPDLPWRWLALIGAAVFLALAWRP